MRNAERSGEATDEEPDLPIFSVAIVTIVREGTSKQVGVCTLTEGFDARETVTQAVTEYGGTGTLSFVIQNLTVEQAFAIRKNVPTLAKRGIIITPELLLQGLHPSRS